jgi:hypothetical protein
MASNSTAQAAVGRERDIGSAGHEHNRPSTTSPASGGSGAFLDGSFFFASGTLLKGGQVASTR